MQKFYKKSVTSSHDTEKQARQFDNQLNKQLVAIYKRQLTHFVQVRRHSFITIWDATDSVRDRIFLSL